MNVNGVSTQQRVRQLLPGIKRAILKAEEGLTDRKPWQVHAESSSYAMTQGPNHAVYHSSEGGSLLTTLDNLKLDPRLIFGDLGAGLGMACFAAAGYFNDVVGFEVDERFHNAAEEIRISFGLDSILFLHQDFTARTYSFKYLGVVYFYKPFFENFNLIMGATLLRLSTGAIIISRGACDSSVFPSEYFRELPESVKRASYLETLRIYEKTHDADPSLIKHLLSQAEQTSPDQAISSPDRPGK